MENFFLDPENTPASMRKPDEKILQIKKIILEEKPDILMMLEVGGLESIKIFNKKYLNDKYTPFLLKGNSDRGIEMGHLIKKSLNYNFEIFSHRERFLNTNLSTGQQLKFSRDISELRISQNKKLQCIIFLVHLKSKWDRDGNDPNGALRRGAELKTLIDVYNDYQKLYPEIPIIIAGDFNGMAQKNNCEPEFKYLYENSNLLDVLELLPISNDDKNTYFQFTRDGKRQGYQLDYIFIPPILQTKIISADSGVYRYKNDQNSTHNAPISIYERASLPSDHYPLVLTLDFLK